MQLNSTEISELIKQRIAQFNVVSEAHIAQFNVVSEAKLTTKVLLFLSVTVLSAFTAWPIVCRVK
ncbi:hypothetical protein LTSEMIS_5172 [Salmonella enterica subsp. enterica serovar Mississippi str. A4-633]|nr:hypothetical protein LTSEMIS_5172 [Salmonella enterica subsp. enterica serovar Mississippi str. A4-633]